MLQSSIKNLNNYCALVKVNMNNTKLNVSYKRVLQEVCEKFNGAEQYIIEWIEALFGESKLSIDEVTYFVYNNFEAVVEILQLSF